MMLQVYSQVESPSPGPEHWTEKQEARYHEDISHLNRGTRSPIIRQPAIDHAPPYAKDYKTRWNQGEQEKESRRRT
jgi:hypothetical protein